MLQPNPFVGEATQFFIAQKNSFIFYIYCKNKLKMKKLNATVIPTLPTVCWDEQEIKLKAKFLNLSHADLYFEEGKKAEMLTKIQTKLGKTKEEFQKIIANL